MPSGYLRRAAFSISISTGGAWTVDQVTSRTIGELKKEIVDRAAREPQRKPTTKVKTEDLRQEGASTKTLDRASEMREN